MIAQHMVRTAIILGVFAVIGGGLVATTYLGTRERIAESERQFLLQSLHQLIPPERHDNDLFTDTTAVVDPHLLGSRRSVTVFRARKSGRPVAAVLSPVAPDGYNGNIRLLVAINYDGTLAGVRTLQHRETPGLGDAIDIEKSDWILGFDGRSLTNPPPAEWHVRRDGGVFDQFTGATITPRAVVKSVFKSLQYFAGHRDALFATDVEPQQTAAQNEL